MANNITIGTNYISEVDLVDSDGNSVTRASIDTMTVQIRQYGRVIESITKPNAKLTDGTTASKQKIELSPATSLLLREGKVLARVVSGDNDVLYTVGGARISMPDYHILTAYFEQAPEDDALVTTIEHYRGLYDASTNVAPSSNGSGTGGAIIGGDYWTASVAGVIFGIPVAINTRIEAKVNSPGQTSGNWLFLGAQG